MNNMEPILKEIFDGILNGDNKTVPSKVQLALDSGLGPSRILSEAMIAAMSEVGGCSRSASISSRKCCSPLAPCKPGWRC